MPQDCDIENCRAIQNEIELGGRLKYGTDEFYGHIHEHVG